MSKDDLYCSRCGAKKIDEVLTLKAIGKEVQERYLELDSALLLTFLDLFRKPEAVADGYINGLRKRYMPLSNYFALAITLTGLLFVFAKKINPQDFVIPEASSSMENIMAQFNLVFEYQGLINLILLPLGALMTKLVFIDKKKYNYVGHLVWNGFYIAQTFIAVFLFSLIPVLLGADYFLITNLPTIPVLLYYVWMIKRLYAMGWWEAIGRFLLYMVAYIILVIGVMAIAGIGFALYLLATDQGQNISV
ncbi:DUF3667 domain-containing protein [Croceiramulus getboli]|nr:DUF3667 domain-containing protein [Flavobacteriaceae bacterium YJPT1-3]